jgi:3-oxoacyl-ACP reductase-like protein
MEETTVATAKKTTAKKTTVKKTAAKKTTAKKTTAKKAPAKKAPAKKTTAKKSSSSGLFGGLSDLTSKLNSKDTAQKVKSAMKTMDTVKSIQSLTKGGDKNALLDLGKKALQSKLDSMTEEDD